MKKVYKFMSRFDHTIIFEGSRIEITYDAMGHPIAKKIIPALKFVFQNKYAETTDERIVQLIQEHPEWAVDVFWHPTNVPPELGKEGVEKATVVADAAMESSKRKAKAVEAAREGGVERDQ
jgi:hypothetical protein